MSIDPVLPSPPSAGAPASDATPLPAWYERNLAAEYEALDVRMPDGRRIEARAWGRRGAPGLLFVHGNSAHLGWWHFLAPFFADRFRVVAFSLGGMGQSDWAESYSVAGFASEMWAAADAAGLDESDQAPIIVAHSMGGLPLVYAATKTDRAIRGGILVDVGFPGMSDITIPPYAGHRLYPDEAAAVSRFRLSPPQPCENRWLLKDLGRMAVRQVTTEAGESGWSWRFDPKLWGGVEASDVWDQLRAARYPMAIIRGAESVLTGPKMMAAICDALPATTPVISIPGAYHHVVIDQPIATAAVLDTLFKTWLGA